ncbi:MAG: hypothetical protein KGJ80_13245 [Chloroflexota bacterium]|nr:hypothetical protein [Chloroflexota bacterium]
MLGRVVTLLTLVLAALAVSCSKPLIEIQVAPSPTVPPVATPIPPTATPVPPTATPVPPTATPVPPTMTPVPPTSTPVPPTATRLPTQPPPSPTSEFPPGMGAVVVSNYVGQYDIFFSVDGKGYTVKANGGRQTIFLAPGKYVFSANIPRPSRLRCELFNGCTVTIKPGEYTPLDIY